MVDLEVPTAPPSPVLRPATPYSGAHEDPIKRDSSNVTPPSAGQSIKGRRLDFVSAPYKVKRVNKEHNIPREPICADEPQCVICYKWLPSLPTKMAKMKHVNECWNELREKVTAAKEQELWFLEYEAEQARLEEPGATQDDVHELEKVRDEESSEVDSKSSPVLEVATRTSAKDIPPTACIFCAKDLSKMRGTDAYEHRVRCLNAEGPSSCPICQNSFDDPPPAFIGTIWQKKDILLHLYRCQHGGTLTHIQADDFEYVLAAWSGRVDIAKRKFYLAFGPRKKWTHREHRKSIQTKRASSCEEGQALYVVKPSPLRTAQELRSAQPFKSDTEIEVTTYTKTALPKYVSLDRFRLSAYSVMPLPKGKNPPKGFKTKTVVRETVSVVDPNSAKAFWGKLENPQSLPKRPIPAVPVTSPKKTLPIESAAAENFPITNDQPSRPKLQRQPFGVPQPNGSMTELQAILNAPTRPASPKNRQSEEVARPPKPSTVKMPRSIRKFPQVVFTCPAEDGDNSFAPTALQQTASPSTSTRLPAGVASATMSSLPMRLPQDTAAMSVQTPRRDSLEGTRPLMLPDPHAHTVFFANGGSTTFGEGVVPPHPDSVRIEQAAEEPSVIGHASQDEEEDAATDDQEDQATQTPSPTHALTPLRTPNRGLNWADEMEDLDYAPQSAPWSAALPHRLDRISQNGVEASNGDGTPEPSITPKSVPPPIQQILRPTLFVPRPAGQPLHPHMFQCPDELDQNIQYETYSYGSRGDIWVGLRSSLRTIIDPGLTEQEQRERNRDACRLNFGSLRRNLHYRD